MSVSISQQGPAERTMTLDLAAVEISGVGKTFTSRRDKGEGRRALQDVDIRVEAGEFVSLVGPSGCGKSTLLNILAGFVTADAGSVTVDGAPITGPGADRGVLFQTPNLFPWLTVWHNVLYGPRARRMLSPQIRAEAEQLLATVGLTDARDAYPHELSGGMRHRAAFARVLINRPLLLLMDEPFGALDAITRASMQDFLLELWQRNRTTIVFVTHDVEEAALLSDRVIVLSSAPGRVVAEVPVTLPRPRSLESADTLEFLDVKRSIRAHLDTTSGRGRT
jgi:NitT/TauT family transport system ATP-binding protein